MAWSLALCSDDAKQDLEALSAYSILWRPLRRLRNYYGGLIRVQHIPHRTENIVHSGRSNKKETRSQDILLPTKRSPLIHYGNMELIGGTVSGIVQSTESRTLKRQYATVHYSILKMREVREDFVRKF